MLTATCHCGAVRLEVARAPQVVTSCNCSICRRLGALWAYYTGKSVTPAFARDAVVAYVWNDRVIEFYHCRTCGCATHYESTRKGPDERIAINVRCFPPDELAAVRVRRFDGAVSWKYLDDSV